MGLPKNLLAGVSRPTPFLRSPRLQTSMRSLSASMDLISLQVGVIIEAHAARVTRYAGLDRV